MFENNLRFVRVSFEHPVVYFSKKYHSERVFHVLETRRKVLFSFLILAFRISVINFKMGKQVEYLLALQLFAV